MYFRVFHTCFVIFFSGVLSHIPEDLISELYVRYREAVDSDNPTSLRRLFTEDREYKIHVKKLKDVNGYKRHNLFVKEILRKGEKQPFIYINNPVESKIPNAFLTIDEFKDALIARVSTTKKKYVHTRKTVTSIVGTIKNYNDNKSSLNSIITNAFNTNDISAARVTKHNDSMSLKTTKKLQMRTLARNSNTLVKPTKPHYNKHSIQTTNKIKQNITEVTNTENVYKDIIYKSNLETTQKLNILRNREKEQNFHLNDKILDTNETVIAQINATQIKHSSETQQESNWTNIMMQTSRLTPTEATIEDVSTILTTDTTITSQVDTVLSSKEKRPMLKRRKSTTESDFLSDILNSRSSITFRTIPSTTTTVTTTRKKLGRPLVFMGRE